MLRPILRVCISTLNSDPTRVPVSPEKPHGLDYALMLHGPDGERLVGFGNAYPVAKQTRTMALARGERLIALDEPKMWFISTKSFENHGRLWPGPAGVRRARPHHAEGYA